MIFLVNECIPLCIFRSEALSILSEARQATLLSAFVTALTRGGPSGFPRPIELHAHDPIRYLGDILAWVHQTIAAEREFVDNLFGIKSDKRMMGSVRKLDNEEEWMKELMDLSVSKFCVPLRVGFSVTSWNLANEIPVESATNDPVTGEQHRVVQDRQFVAILPADNVSNHRRAGVAFDNTQRVCFFNLHHKNPPDLLQINGLVL